MLKDDLSSHVTGSGRLLNSDAFCLRSEAFQLIEFDWKRIEFFRRDEKHADRDAVLFHLGIFLTVATAKSNGRTIEPEAASVGGPFEWKSAAAAQRL
jgi:hypothetical protein